MLNLYLPFIIFFPMVGALICYLVGKKSKKLRDILANVITIGEFAATVSFIAFLLYMMSSYFKGFNMPLTVSDMGKNLSGLDVDIPLICGFGLKLTFDGFRAVYAVVVSFMWIR